MSGARPFDPDLAPGGPERASGDQRDWLQITLSSIGDGIITTDASGRVNYLNPVAEKLTGWKLADAIGMAVEEVFHIVSEKTRKPVDQPVRKVVEQGLTVGLGNHTILIARDGSERPIDDSAAPIKDNRDNLVGVVLVFRDITERRQSEHLIERAKEYAETIVTTVREPLLVLDKELHIVSANSSFYETFRVRPSQTEGKFVYELGDGQWDIPALRTLLTGIIPENSSFDDFEVEHDFEQIGPKTMLLNARRFPSEGPYELILLAIEDITDRKRMAHAVATSEVRYRRLFEAARDGILLLDPDTRRITDANPFMVELLGYRRDELVGKELWEIGLLTDEQASREAFHKLQETGSIRYEDLPLQSRTGTRREVEFVSNSYQEDGQRVIQCNIRDITERKRAAKILRESEARLRAIFDGSLDAIVVADDEGRYVDANPSACDLFGLSKAELSGRRIPDFAEPGFSFDQSWQTFLRDGQSRGEFRLVRPDGVARDLEFSATANIRSGQHVSILRDVTERKQLEKELKRHAEELAEADRRKDEFLAMLGHELRNPIAPIRNALHLVRLSQQEPRQEVRQAYDIIERQVENLVRLVDDLLDLGRVTSGKIQLQKECVDLAAVVARAIEGARPLIDARRHTLEVHLPDALVPVEADPVRLAQVLWNLLNNAAKYTPDGGRITLEVERGDEAVVRIRDTGIGIAPEMLPKVFDLFTQMDRSLDRAEGGLGIGLTLVRR
ncbi:MAG: PAS domain S-box protein, partial [Isosphaeraceae bacterium]